MAGKKRSRLRFKLLVSLAIFFGVCLIGVVGFLLFSWELMDAIYMVVITIFGVGYGEVEPVDEPGERIFTMALIIGGNGAAVYVVSQVIGIMTEGEIAMALGDMRESRRVEGISHHTIICGYGRIGQVLAHALAEHGSPFVIVDLDKERIEMAHSRNYLVIEGSATEEETLIKAGIDRADFLTTVLPQDTLNVFITLTARNLNKDIRIIARGEQPSTEKKLRQAGATEVILPSSIGGLRIAGTITKPALADFVGGKAGTGGADFHHLGLEIHELSLDAHGHLVGWSVGEIQRKAEGNMMVLAVRRANGGIVRDGVEKVCVEPGDALVVMGRTEGLPAFIRSMVKDTELI
jgi:voltage-gated potassium channel